VEGRRRAVLEDAPSYLAPGAGLEPFPGSSRVDLICHWPSQTSPPVSTSLQSRPMADDHLAQAGWYADPFERHERRYFDGGWTDRVSDGGVESTDAPTPMPSAMTPVSPRSFRPRLIGSLLGTIFGCVLIIYEVGFAAQPHRVGEAIAATVIFLAISAAVDYRIYQKYREIQVAHQPQDH
jgi:Protein of unknown function (DUF2510)